MNRHTNRRLGLLAGSALLLVAATPAFAQTHSIGGGSVMEAPEPGGEPGDEPGPSNLGDVFVTATKRETNLQKTRRSPSRWSTPR
jgi:iron complex outermembrane receptor protein